MAKQDRARLTQERVLDAAAEEFGAHGFAATNLQVVADRIGLTKGALYGHFPSKAALAHDLTCRFEEGWQEILRTAERSPATAQETLQTVTVELAARLQQDVRFAAGLRLVWEAARAQGTTPAELLRLRSVLAALVGRAQQDGEISPGHEPELLAGLLLSMVLGVHHVSGVAQPGTAALQLRGMWQVLLPALRPTSA
ncbi:TetR/AcrR family transcriptional regulator [Streptomyces sp. ZAF1911]|uniref:TetR/AcrR family transcriptional regulator n=1 Tax=Streptomyces sp. ZAF1911 TaxID=2944129 RepID=UPI00237AB707|nr:TetR/AcrR family transcriptional regulator [Streptomyces sp. ZAF1911]MDD9382975.1 TetR/AcrR family transcriptional regulator [Streptomyces sp. ZAF1911]